MGAGYSNDLRVRVIRFIEKGAAARGAARHFEIGDSTAIRWVRRWRDTGSTRVKPRSRESRSPLKAHEQWLLDLVGRESDPDALFAAGAAALGALREASSSLPIVFANARDPVGAGYVDSMARPGGNATGFMSAEYGQSGKWLQLLKQIAPHITRVAVIRLLAGGDGQGQLAAVQAVATLYGVAIIPVNVRTSAELERGVTDIARRRARVRCSGQWTGMAQSACVPGGKGASRGGGNRSVYVLRT